ncbi:hypothetical protein [Synechococcus sp. CC9616]|uniref:hypothetical protein n=1 Tax=Synechococcus sp. CC9616 TaxID=110663 RepID=UPI0012EB96AE|nr:hypothetical protein [Synechococcus sp. CC9616]
MKLFPLLGALLLSTAPVQAFETWEELSNVCLSTDEIVNICTGVGDFVGAATMVSLLCTLEAKGSLTKEKLVLYWDDWYEWNYRGRPLSNEAVEKGLKAFPGCSLKPKL